MWRQLIDREKELVRLVNFTEQPLRNVNVWVNHSFVQRVVNVPPRGSVALANKNFFDSTGHSLVQLQVIPSAVQVETSDHQLQNLLGPVNIN